MRILGIQKSRRLCHDLPRRVTLILGAGRWLLGWDDRLARLPGKQEHFRVASFDLSHFVPSSTKWLAAEAATCVFHSQKKQDMQCKRAEGALGTG